MNAHPPVVIDVLGGLVDLPVTAGPVIPAGAAAVPGTTADAAPTPADLADILGLTDPAQVHTGVPQAQGDVLVMPWPEHSAPADRDRAVCAARPVPMAGWAVLTGRQGHAHTVLADGPDVRIARDGVGAGLAVLCVGEESVAVLAHETHPDLHIGHGVYVLRRQRRYAPEEPESLAAYVYD